MNYVQLVPSICSRLLKRAIAASRKVHDNKGEESKKRKGKTTEPEEAEDETQPYTTGRSKKGRRTKPERASASTAKPKSTKKRKSA